MDQQIGDAAEPVNFRQFEGSRRRRDRRFVRCAKISSTKDLTHEDLDGVANNLDVAIRLATARSEVVRQ